MFMFFRNPVPVASAASRVDRRRRSRLVRPLRVEGLENRDLMAALGLDPTFGLGGISLSSNPSSSGNATSIYSYFGNVAIQSDGKILAVGTRSTYTSTATSSTSSTDVIVERLNANSTIDNGFGTNGVATIALTSGTTALDGTGVDLAIQSDGKILVLGSTSTRNLGSGVTNTIADFAVARLNANGTIDTSFNGTGYRLVDFTPTNTTGNVSDTPTSLALAPGGKIVVAGSTQTPGSVVNGTPVLGSQDMAVARLNADGSLDTTFNKTGEQVVAFDLGGANSDIASAVTVGSDGKVILAGSAGLADITSGADTFSTSDIAVARLNSDGSLDGSFGTGGKKTVAYDLGGDKSDSASAVALAGTNIVLVGTSSVSTGSSSAGNSANSTSDLTVTRLTSSGALDTTFNTTGKFAMPSTLLGTAVSTTGSGLVVLPDGSLVVAGTASRPGQYDSIGLFAKLTTAGALDSSYGTGGVGLLGGATPYGNIALQGDGKIVFSTGGGVARTTAPAPLALSVVSLTTGTGKKVKGGKVVTVQFNTALNPVLAGSVSSYQVRNGTKGKKFLAIKSVSYDASTFTTTINLKQAAPTKGTLQLILSASGIVGQDSALLNGGQSVTMTISRTAPSTT